MKTRLELVTMACDLHVDAYMAGTRNSDEKFDAARADRRMLCNALDEVFDEIHDMKERIRDLEHEYRMTLEASDADIAKYKRELENLRDQVRSQQETIRKLTLTDPDNPDSPMWKDFAPDTSDLPFPEVEDELTKTGLLEEDE